VAELVRVVKQGRSLGMHLLVASQQPAKAVTDDIRTQLKFFVALRLGSSEDSREMLGKPDAAFLPTDAPGRAYFRVGAEVTLFQSALVVGPYRSQSAAPSLEDDVVFHGPMRAAPQATDAAPTKATRATTDMDVLVRALRQAGADLFAQEQQQTGWAARPIWQPPLPARLTLGEVRPQQQGAVSGSQAQDWLRPFVGRLDIPQESRQEPLRIDLRAGHLAVIGTAGSGKTTLLRTLLLDLALSHAPQDLWSYVIDAGGQGLRALADLPQIGGIIPARDRERVRRLLTMIDREIRRRQELFREVGANDLLAYRRHARLPAWVIVIDKLALLREEFKDKHGYETITDDLIRLIRVARTYGVHFIITADSVRDMTNQLLTLFDARIALRLPDVQDYAEVIGSRVTSQIPATTPGRGLWSHPDLGTLDLQVALPLLDAPDAVTDTDELEAIAESDLNAALDASVAQLRATSAGAPDNGAAPGRIELLPEQLTPQELGTNVFEQRPLAAEVWAPIGKESVDLTVAHLRLNQETPHALVLGGRRSGKTTAMQSILLALAQSYHAEHMRFVIVAPRRSLRPLAQLPHTACYATSEAEIKEAVVCLETMIERAKTAPQQRLIVAVDDYDIGYRQIESQFRSSYDGANLFSVLKRLAVEGDAHSVHVLVAANVKYPEEAGDVVRTLEAGRNGLILWPHKYDGGTRLLDVALPQGDRDADLPPGRGLLVREDSALPVQVAATPQAEVDQAVANINDEGSGKREQGSGNREQGSGNREQGSGNREAGTGKRDERRLTTDD
jgi:S-DNA-T family DNA segregation ATPase FtsK/SpoIIIE